MTEDTQRLIEIIKRALTSPPKQGVAGLGLIVGALVVHQEARHPGFSTELMTLIRGGALLDLQNRNDDLQDLGI